MKNFFKTALFVFFIPAFAWSIDLSQAQKQAEEQNHSLRALAGEVDEASWKKLEALSGHLPHISLSARRLFDEKFVDTPVPAEFGGGTLPAVEPFTYYRAQASLTVFDGLATWNRYQAARLGYEAKRFRYSRAKLALDAEVRLEFYRALGAQNMVDVADQNIKTLEQHLNDVNAQIRGGISTKFDSLRIEVQLQDARTEKMAADDDLILARQKFWKVLGVPDDGLPFSGALPAQWNETKYQQVQFKIENREDREAQLREEEAISHLSSAAKGFWFPRVDLFGSHDWYNNLDKNWDGPNGTNYKPAYMVGVMLTWDLFDGGRSLAQEYEAAARMKQSEEKLKDLNTQIPLDVEFWKRRLLYSISSYKAKQLAIAKAQESVRLARNGVRAGTRTNTEVLDAELDLNRAKAKSVTAQIDAIEALGNLELAVGHAL